MVLRLSEVLVADAHGQSCKVLSIPGASSARFKGNVHVVQMLLVSSDGYCVAEKKAMLVRASKVLSNFIEGVLRSGFP